MNRLLLGICGYDNVPFGFVRQLTGLYRDGFLPLVAAQGLHIQRNRNAVVKQALEAEGWDYLLFLDTDMVLPDSLRSRVEGYTDPVVGGLYFRRVWPDYRPVPGMLAEGDLPMYESLTPEQLEPMLDVPGLYPCDVLGTGCLAIRRDVLEGWPEALMPWFNVALSTDGQNLVTEDVWFCWQLKRQGIQAMLDTEARCGHIGSFTVGTNSYRSLVREADGTGQ
jgi:hypothetical protein